jgi:hypothetical protein
MHTFQIEDNHSLLDKKITIKPKYIFKSKSKTSSTIYDCAGILILIIFMLILTIFLISLLKPFLDPSNYKANNTSNVNTTTMSNIEINKLDDSDNNSDSDSDSDSNTINSNIREIDEDNIVISHNASVIIINTENVETNTTVNSTIIENNAEMHIIDKIEQSNATFKSQTNETIDQVQNRNVQTYNTDGGEYEDEDVDKDEDVIADKK